MHSSCVDAHLNGIGSGVKHIERRLRTAGKGHAILEPLVSFLSRVCEKLHRVAGAKSPILGAGVEVVEATRYGRDGGRRAYVDQDLNGIRPKRRRGSANRDAVKSAGENRLRNDYPGVLGSNRIGVGAHRKRQNGLPFYDRQGHGRSEREGSRCSRRKLHLKGIRAGHGVSANLKFEPQGIPRALGKIRCLNKGKALTLCRETQ